MKIQMKIIEQRYKDEEISFELIGLCTDICVVSNALVLKANFPEVPISVPTAEMIVTIIFTVLGSTDRTPRTTLKKVTSAGMQMIDTHFKIL